MPAWLDRPLDLTLALSNHTGWLDAGVEPSSAVEIIERRVELVSFDAVFVQVEGFVKKPHRPGCT